jgi:aminoglycoside phosphotransferase
MMSPSSLEQGTSQNDGTLQGFIDLGSSGFVTDWDDLFSALDARII